MTDHTAHRRPYRREAEEKRRDDLIAAAIALVSEGGAEAATVRAIADRAGVTPGLIRHYFATKDDLTQTAYRLVMERMTQSAVEALSGAAPDDPVGRLAAFVAANFRAPVLDPVNLSVWAAYLHRSRNDPTINAVHQTTYLAYRDQLQTLIAALPGRPVDAEKDRRDAISCNALIDGLWIEGAALPDAFRRGEVARIALDAIGAILRHPLPSPPDI
ncbi:TetR/AcrR family transcriptional regulator [Paragemmobacter straminiformis]|uniref:TetR family transcriptional regulator C-terminal domain-containing protein n=1 Tax=Paragemmobacter straminiformis TaxID=2045119 RepID=A0A842I2A2_9RHOB|nr:TetR family transcriptional regulator C-terminal domain-containing protein [Gemmobacter straminiformis]MBC2834402.1 TetR family transcriptional regulator C-terminal domain-containing protein [Gemmobacter straminiformis]